MSRRTRSQPPEHDTPPPALPRVMQLDPLPRRCPRCNGPWCAPDDRRERAYCLSCGERVYYPTNYRGPQ